VSNTRISVTEADIDDNLMRQHGVPAGRTSSIKIPKPSFKKSGNNKAPLFAVIAVLALVGVGGVGYQKYSALQKENQRLANPQAAAEDEANRLKQEVGALIELPNENPTIATVVDVEKLKNQTFFANAQNGDRVLLFASAKKAVLYRPTTKKIVEVAPINIGDTAGVAGASTTGGTTQQTTPTNKTR
jgi:hypothetical protein